MPNKSLGQHWLKDPAILSGIADSAGIVANDTVLEIGPGLGTLTSALLRRARNVVAVEYDSELARKLPAQFPGKRLQVIHADILQFDLSTLPPSYRVVANVPYYITQKIIERFLYAGNQPESMALLVQREVAEKLVSRAGNLTPIAVKLQYQYDVQLGTRVPKEYFIPPPLIDSQVIICKKKHVDKNVHYDISTFYRVVDAGFSAPRKKLRTSLAGGLGLSKQQVETVCRVASVDPDLRPGAVNVTQWLAIMEAYDTSRSA